MNQQITLISLAAVLLLGFAASQPTGTARAAAANQRGDLPPRLSDTLTVAKSPFEPITLTPNAPNARNDGRSPLAIETTVAKLPTDEIEKRTTRSAQSFEEQQSSSSTRGLDESSGIIRPGVDQVAAGSSPSTVTTEATLAEESTNATESPVESAAETDTTKSNGENEAAQTTTITTKTTTTTTTQAPITSSPEVVKTTTEQPEATTTTPTTTITTTTTTTTPEPTTTEGTTTAGPASPASSEPPAKEEENLKEATVAPVAEISTTTAGSASTELPVKEEPTVAPVAELSTTTTATTSAPSEPPSAPVNADITTTTTTTTTPEAPIASTTTEAASTSSVAPNVDATTLATTSTTTASAPEPEKKEEEKPVAACNHLPTYDSDEIQRVFREETTYKNRTIKGKFTYINFDQRYRLVHYTRLPYGPVKIDRVEELGRPKQQGDGTNASNESTPTLSEVPNAVLQLRNLLPNSLFGFPFLGPNTAGSHLSPSVGSRAGSAGDGDRNSMYFYSTDSISTPNLLTPRVPVSLLPGQQRPTSSDILASVSQEHALGADIRPQRIAFGMPSSQDDYSKQLNKLAGDQSPVPKMDAVAPQTNQFQYAGQHSTPESNQNQKGFVYSYYSSHVQPAHYQYAPVPPAYQPLGHFRPSILSASMNDPTQYHQHPHPYHHLHHHHQPHGHEHYTAPFMLAQPPATEQAQPNSESSSRLKLKVKSSKALNVDSQEAGATKSAQLRAHSASSGHYSSPLNSPVRQYQQSRQQRLGKQNQQLVKPTIKHSPVVYHVLRNPSGQVYSHQQFSNNQGYAMAYDQDTV